MERTKTIKQISKELIKNKVNLNEIENYLDENEFMYSENQFKLIKKEFIKLEKRVKSTEVKK